MQCVQNRPGPPHIKFLPKQPLPRPRATYLASHSLATPALSPGWGRPWPDLFQTTFPGPGWVHLTGSHTVHPLPASPPPPEHAQIIHNAFKAGPALPLPKPALPHPFNNVNRENRTNGSLSLLITFKNFPSQSLLPSKLFNLKNNKSYFFLYWTLNAFTKTDVD